jgi:hypothetical protein
MSFLRSPAPLVILKRAQRPENLRAGLKNFIIVRTGWTCNLHDASGLMTVDSCINMTEYLIIAVI